MNCCAGEDDAGGFILIETNLPNANAADSSIAGCIFSLTHNICLVFCVSTQCSRGKASSPTDGWNTHKKEGTAVYCGTGSVWIVQKLWRAEASDWVALCDVERERGDRIKVDVFGPSGARSPDWPWKRMGTRHGNAETARVFSLLQQCGQQALVRRCFVWALETGGWGVGVEGREGARSVQTPVFKLGGWAL